MIAGPRSSQPLSSKEILELDAQHGSGLWKPDLALVRGEGVRVWDADGREYLDCLAGIAVASLGHNHPRLVRAVSEQAQKLIVFGQNMGNDTRSLFLEKLFNFVPAPLARTFLASSGSEVNEAAIKWARVATGRPKFIAARKGFSGRTMGVLGLTWEPTYREPFGPLGVEVHHVTYNSVEDLNSAIDERTAAVFIEPIQGEGGMNAATGEFLKAAQDLARERGALLILDEIQSGAGRTGRFLAGEWHGVQPDMVTLAKGLGGGVPIGALLMTEEVARAMPAGGHGSTFGGNPLASAAGLAVLQELEEANLLAHVRSAGERLQAGLAGIGGPLIREVRGKGLMIGVELAEAAAPYIGRLREAGVLTVGAGSHVIRFVPPLIISEDEVDEVVERAAGVLGG